MTSRDQTESGFKPFVSGAVGDGRRCASPDVEAVKTMLQMLGRYPAAEACNGILDRALDEALRRYQRDRGLKQDGWLGPGGDTERCLCLDLAALTGEREG